MNQSHAPLAAEQDPLSDGYVNAVIRQHGYGHPTAVAARLWQWIGRHGGENGLTLLIYEAHKALSKLRAEGVQAGAGWQPIDTAPAGIRILLGPRDCPVVGVVRITWNPVSMENERSADVVHYNGTRLVAGYRCTEWAPLHAAPMPAMMADVTPPATARERWYYDQGRLAEREASAPVAYEKPIKLSDDVLHFLKEGVENATQCEEADVDQEFADQLLLLMHTPLYTEPRPIQREVDWGPLVVAPVAGEARPAGWQNALRIAELPEVDEALANFCEDSTLHNAVGLVLAVLGAAPQAGEAVCSCPTGDGSLRHPCAVHPPGEKDGGHGSDQAPPQSPPQNRTEALHG